MTREEIVAALEKRGFKGNIEDVVKLGESLAKTRLNLPFRPTIRSQVLAFHEAMRVPVAQTPAVPADNRMRLRLRLITEEYWELLESCGIECPLSKASVLSWIESKPLDVDLVSLADALGDLDYVVEGTRLECGIDGGPVAAEIQRSNMAKVGGAMREDGKILKPDGWAPPDIAGELRKQGWEG